jgi:hypothetical protein
MNENVPAVVSVHVSEPPPNPWHGVWARHGKYRGAEFCVLCGGTAQKGNQFITIRSPRGSLLANPATFSNAAIGGGYVFDFKGVEVTSTTVDPASIQAVDEKRIAPLCCLIWARCIARCYAE